MKTLSAILLSGLMLFSGFTFAQIAVNSDGNPPNSKSILDVTSTTKGLLIPRMLTSQRNTLGNTLTASEKGMLVYDTELGHFYYFDGTDWLKIATYGSADGDWTISGNNMYSSVSGDVGIGKTSNFQGKLDVKGKIYADNSSSDALQVNLAGSPSIAPLQWWSSENNGLEINGAEGHGVFVGAADKSGLYVHNAAENGVYINSATLDGLNVAGATRNGVLINSAGNKGFNVLDVGSASGFQSSTEKNGFDVGGADGNGLFVGYAGADGVKIYKAGTPNGIKSSSYSNGVEVNGAQGNGVYVGRVNRSGIEIDSAGQYGVRVNNAIGDAIYVANTSDNGLHIQQSTEDAIYIANAGSNGISIDNATAKGVSVGTAGTDGLYIYKAGNPTTTSASSSKNGIEITGAEGYGIYIGQADDDGVYVLNADYGFTVSNAVYTGVMIWNAGTNGVHVLDADEDGIKVGSAGDRGVYANTTQSSHEWGIYTPDKIYGSNVTSKSSSTYGKNIGSQPLQAGDVVCIAGGMENNIEGTENLFAINLEKADEANKQAVFGVVEYKVNIKSKEETKSFAHADGNIYQGDYFSVIIFGPAEVNVNSNANIKIGNNVCVGNNGATTQIVKNINGIDIAENTGIIGKSMGNISRSGKMLVYVNCK